MKILALIWAGTSVASGIASFRWKWKKDNLDLRFFDINFIKKHKLQAIEFYKNLLKDFLDKPYNDYHYFLNELDEKYDLTVISQNIDNLDIHYKNIVKIHWKLDELKCINNYKHKIENWQKIWDRCKKCNSYLFPNILYYGENYKKEDVEKLNKIKKQEYDLFLVIWTSLQIAFVENYIRKIKAKNKININPEIEISWFENLKDLDSAKNYMKSILQ